MIKFYQRLYGKKNDLFALRSVNVVENAQKI